jgi:hypothetical protein
MSSSTACTWITVLPSVAFCQEQPISVPQRFHKDFWQWLIHDSMFMLRHCSFNKVYLIGGKNIRIFVFTQTALYPCLFLHISGNVLGNNLCRTVAYQQVEFLHLTGQWNKTWIKLEILLVPKKYRETRNLGKTHKAYFSISDFQSS